MEKLLLDTDIGGDIDDALCLAYLLKEPGTGLSANSRCPSPLITGFVGRSSGF